MIGKHAYCRIIYAEENKKCEEMLKLIVKNSDVR
jgi:hypothetical protein